MKTNWTRSALLLTLAIITSSCTLMLPDRSFMEQMERESDPFYSPGKDFPVVGGDDGETHLSREELNSRIPASRRTSALTKEARSLQQELEDKEADLSEYEMEQYVKVRKFLISDSDKLYYLSLAPGERAAYIRTVKSDISEEMELRSNMVAKRSIHARELFLGMDKDDVVDAWGKPAKVEIAGNPKNQNERWSFVEDGSVKQVYFESGKVQGWALDL